MYDLLMVRYGELGLKGKNKAQFINRLQQNIRKAMEDLEPRSIECNWGRILIPICNDLDEMVERLEKVFGIYSMSPAIKVEKNMDEISKTAWEELKNAMPNGGKFKVETKRSDKKFPLSSPEITQEVAGYIFDRCGDNFVAEMHKPENIVHVEIRDEGAFVYSKVIKGAKGLPVGTSGKAVVMLSGGIDSPVAAYLGMKRGVRLEAVHFHSYPFTTERAKEKVVDLCEQLAKLGNININLHVVHFTDIQKEIYAKCPEEYGITIMRRFMFRLAERIAKQQDAKAIYTGECVGQVASQTLDSMVAINDVTTMPILRPVVGMDKEEIVAIAEKIGTYETSILPYEDCCTLFLPKYPKIRPNLEQARDMEKNLDVEGLIQDALDKTEVIKVRC